MRSLTVLGTALLALLSTASASTKAPYKRHVDSVNQTTTEACESVPVYSNEELFNMTKNFWDNFMYPNNCVQSKSINSTLLSEDVLGRIDATRNFVGRELNTEYMFGLFCQIQENPNTFSVFGSPTNYTFTQFVGRGNLAASTVRVNFNVMSVNLLSPVDITTFINFDENKQISQYDATFKWLDWQFANLDAVGLKALNLTSATALENVLTMLISDNICSVADQYCTGDNQQYASKDECTQFLSNDVRFGEAWELGMNTLLCREVHTNMIPFRPDVHCSHIGKTGGGYCTDDRQYVEYVSADFFTQPGMMQLPPSQGGIQ